MLDMAFTPFPYGFIFLLFQGKRVFRMGMGESNGLSGVSLLSMHRRTREAYALQDDACEGQLACWGKRFGTSKPLTSSNVAP